MTADDRPRATQLQTTDPDIARAQALGRLAAREGRPVSTCPYGDDQRALRMRWVLAYAGAGGRGGLETFTDDVVKRVLVFFGQPAK